MQKRGQVTVFVIIGIFILLVALGLFFLVSRLQKSGLLAEGEENALGLAVKAKIVSFTEDCLRETAIPGIYLLGIQGGVITPDNFEKILLTENAVINYGYLNGVDQLSVREMEKQLNGYVETVLPACLDFTFFEKDGIMVKVDGEPKADVLIGSENVKVSVEQNLKIAYRGDEINLKKFSNIVPLKFGKIVTEAKEIITEHKRNPELVNFGFLSTMEAFVSVLPYDAETTIYSLSDDTSVIDDAPLTFMFAVKDEEANSAPELDYVADFVVKKGERVSYQFTASDPDDDLLTFSSDSTLFVVDEEGLMDVFLSQIGTYNVVFKVKDSQGLEDEQEVRFVVEE